MQRQTIKQKMLANLRSQSPKPGQHRNEHPVSTDPQGKRPRTVTLYM